MKKVAIWTDTDLDGAGSYLVMRWLFKTSKVELEVHTCGPARLRDECSRWLTAKNLADYSAVYFLDIDASNIIDLIDAKNVIIFDHHKTHILQKDKYKNAEVHLEACKSTCQLIYKTYRAYFDQLLSVDQLRLIALVSDYDSYTLSLPESKQLNYLYWTYVGNRYDVFAKDFWNGFKSFTHFQANAIALHHNKVKDVISKLDTFCGKYEEHSVISTFCTTAHNDIAEFLLAKYKVDIIILVNTNLRTVSFRKHKDCTADLSVIAEDLCEGGGHPAAAGGKFTDKFILFTQTLTPCKPTSNDK